MISLPAVPKKRIAALDLRNFSGGLNNAVAATEVFDNQSPDLLNVTFSETGAVSKRAGTTLTGDDKGNVKVLGLHSAYYGNQSAKLLMHANVGAASKLYYRTTGNWSEATGTAIANADVEFENFFDGAAQVVFYTDGTTFAKYDPSGTVVAAATASPATVGPILRVYKNRLYVRGSDGSKPERVYFSDLGDGDAWTATNFFDVPSQNTNETGSSGDVVTALAVFQDRLVIFKTRSVWAWDTNSLTQISNQHGCVGKRAFCVSDNYLYFGDTDGMYRLSGNAIENVSHNIKTTWDAIAAGQLSSMAMNYFQRKVYVVTATAGASANDLTLVYYPQLPADPNGQHPWSYWTGTAASSAAPMGFSSLVVYTSSSTAKPVLIGGAAGAQTVTLQLESGDADYDFTAGTSTQAIMSYYKTKQFFNSARYGKQFATYKSQGSASLITLSTSLDFDTVVKTNNYQMNVASSNVYGTGVYGTAVYGGTNTLIAKGNVSARGKFIQFMAQNNSASQPFTLYRLQQQFAPILLR